MKTISAIIKMGHIKSKIKNCIIGLITFSFVIKIINRVLKFVNMIGKSS